MKRLERIIPFGVSYGGHGVWGWDDGSAPPVAHPNPGVPLPWREALRMPGMIATLR